MAMNALEQLIVDNYNRSQFPDDVPVTVGGITGAEPEALPAELSTPSPAQPAQAMVKPGQAEMKPYDPTMRERLSDFLQAGFEAVGYDRYKAREVSQGLIGGPSSPFPMSLGLGDIAAMFNPAALAAMTPAYMEEGGRAIKRGYEAYQRGDIGQAAMEGVAGAADVLPGAVGVAAGGLKLLKNAPVGLGIKPVTEAEAASMLAAKRGTEAAPQVAEGVVSTRFPTAKKAAENPLEQNLVIGLDAAKSDPAAFAHNVGMASKYPNFVSKATTPDAQAEDFINHVKDNLLFLHDSVPEATRVRSKLWYDGARNIATRYASEYNIPDTGVAGIMAVLSPQKDWFMNVSLGTRVLDILTKQQSHVWDAAMTQKAAEIWAKPQYAPMVKALQGKSLNDIQDPGLRAMWLRTFDEAYLPREHQIISPEGDFVGVRTTQKGAPMKTGWGSLNEIGKAVAIFDNPGVANISTNLGTQHKVRNFYNNIFAPNDSGGHVTIDTHAVAAGLLRPLSGKSREVIHNFGSGIVGEGGTKNSAITGVQGTYPLYAEAYRRAAAERGILPREMQSITWEAVRGLFPDTYKTAQNTAQIDNIWLKYKQGKISLEEARNEVTTAAGGINPPEWERAGLRRESAPAIQTAGNQGELPGAGVPGRRAGRPRRVKPAGGNQAGVNTQQGGIE